MEFPKSLPVTHKQLLLQIIAKLSQDPRVCGIGASGSYTSDSMDKYSDLDLVIAIHPNDFSSVMSSRLEMLVGIDGRVAAFTGEHVGEPRLIIALYQPHAIHVDFKFVALADAAERVDETVVLWQQGNCLTEVLQQKMAQYPQPEPQWIEDRFWIWTHYAATKIARGEYFETLEFISFIRQNVLSPLALKQRGMTPSGVRKVESRLPEFAKQLQETVAAPQRSELISAVEQCISLYLALRENEEVAINIEAQNVCINYFKDELL